MVAAESLSVHRPIIGQPPITHTARYRLFEACDRCQAHSAVKAARRKAFTLASFDRLRVLTTELKRLIAARARVALRLGVAPALDESRLASALWWV